MFADIVYKPRKQAKEPSRCVDVFRQQTFFSLLVQLNKVVALLVLVGEGGREKCHKHDVRSVMYTFLCIFHVCDIPSFHAKRQTESDTKSQHFDACSHFQTMFASFSAAILVITLRALRKDDTIPLERRTHKSAQHTIYHHEFSLGWKFSSYHDADLSDLILCL